GTKRKFRPAMRDCIALSSWRLDGTLGDLQTGVKPGPCGLRHFCNRSSFVPSPREQPEQQDDLADVLLVRTSHCALAIAASGCVRAASGPQKGEQHARRENRYGPPAESHHPRRQRKREPAKPTLRNSSSR